MTDNTNRRITITAGEDKKPAKAKRTSKTGRATKAAGKAAATETKAAGKAAATETKAAGKAATTETKAGGQVAAKVKVGDKCPLCGKGTVIRGRTALGCSRWNEGCTFRLPLREE